MRDGRSWGGPSAPRAAASGKHSLSVHDTRVKRLRHIANNRAGFFESERALQFIGAAADDRYVAWHISFPIVYSIDCRFPR